MLSTPLGQRKTGISLMEELPWGSHFCQFYQTPKDLLEVLVPYFKAGLVNNEYCVWVVAKPLTIRDVTAALKKAVPHFGKRVKKGQFEILTDRQWHARQKKSGRAIVSALDRALVGRFEGLRLANTAPPEKNELDDVTRFNVLAAFAYPQGKFDTIGIMEVIKDHRFALMRNAGKWDVIETSEAQVLKNDLKRSETKLRDISSKMSEAFAYHRIVLDERGKPCDYIFLETNESFDKMTGLKRKQLIGKKVTEVLPGVEKDPANWIGVYGQVAMTGKPVRFENFSEALNKWYAVSAFSSQRGFFVAMFSDITEHKRIQTKLELANEELAASNEELAATNEELRAETEERRRIENILIKNEQRLKWNEQRNAILMESASTMFSAEDPQKIINKICRRTMEFLDCQVFFNFLAVPEKNRLHLNACCGVSKEDADQIRLINYGEAICGCVAQDGVSVLAEDILNTTDPRADFIRKYGVRAFCCHPLLGDKEVIGTIGFGTTTHDTLSDDDVGMMNAIAYMVSVAMQRKKAEEVLKRDKALFEKVAHDRARELIAANIELERAKRLSDIGMLAATVAHELRNPLATIGMAIKNIEKKANNPELDRHLRNIEKKVAESDQIINNLLFYSRIKPPHHETVHITKVVDECVDMVLSQSKKELTIATELTSLMNTTIKADPLQLKEVFCNILNNACDALSENGGKVEISGTDEGDFIKLFVRDNGMGIDQDDLDKVFNPFFTTKAKGTGLGLAVCRQIIDSHGGEVLLNSELGSGTAVALHLPKSNDPDA